MDKVKYKLLHKFPKTVLIVNFDKIGNFYNSNIVITNHKFCNSQVYVSSVDEDLAGKYLADLWLLSVLNWIFMTTSLLLANAVY